MEVTNHAIRRYRERTGRRASNQKARREVARIVTEGGEVFPVNGSKPKDRYFLYNGVVAVVSDETVVTCYLYSRSKWI